MDVREATPVGTVNNATTEQMAMGHKAIGFALAQSVIAYARGHSGEWLRFVGRLIDMSTEARKEFRVELARHVRAMGEHVKATSKTGDVKDADPVYRKAKASATVRLSQLTQISRALDGGMVVACRVNPENGQYVRDGHDVLQPVEPFDTIYGQAQVALNSKASGRGRPTLDFVSKFKKWLATQNAGMEEWQAGDAFLRIAIDAGKMPESPAEVEATEKAREEGRRKAAMR